MANFTTSQQLEISEFFLSHAEGRRECFGSDEEDNALLEADAQVCDRLADYVFRNPIELGKIVREAFDDYEQVFSFMEDYSDEMSEIVDAYWTYRLEQA